MSARLWRVDGRTALAALTAVAALAAVAASLASCRSAPTRVYTLDSIASTAPAGGYAGPQVRVDAIKVPPAWDRLELLQGGGRGEWRIDDLDRWAAPLGQLMRDALTADLGLRLPPDRVIFPSLPKPPGALGLRVDVLDFRADSRGARLEASWIVTPEGGSESAGAVSAIPAPVATAPNAATSHSIVLTAAGPTDGPGATARSLAELLARLADVIVVQLRADSAASSQVNR